MEPFDVWLDRLAAPGPDPGGGAAAAVMLGLGSALAAMVAGYPPQPGGPDLVPTREAADALRARALELVASDAAASARLVAAWRSGSADLAPAAVAAAGTSAAIVAVAAAAEPLLGLLAEHGSRLVLADVAAAAASYGAAVRVATVNLTGNLAAAEDAGAGPDDLAPLAAAVGPADALVARFDVLARLSRIPG